MKLLEKKAEPRCSLSPGSQVTCQIRRPVTLTTLSAKSRTKISVLTHSCPIRSRAPANRAVHQSPWEDSLTSNVSLVLIRQNLNSPDLFTSAKTMFTKSFQRSKTTGTAHHRQAAHTFFDQLNVLVDVLFQYWLKAGSCAENENAHISKKKKKSIIIRMQNTHTMQIWKALS